MASELLGSVVGRLGGLKNISPRRRVTDPEVFNDLEPEEMDVAETSNTLPEFSNFVTPTQNIPEADYGGELTSQSYDVRANTANPPNESQESGFWTKLGRSLKESLTPSLSAEFYERNPNIQRPPETIPEQVKEEGIFNRLGQEASKPYTGMGMQGIAGALSQLGNAIKEGYTPSLSSEVYERNPNLIKPPEMVAQEEAEKQKKQEEVNAGQLNPQKIAIYGATDQFANSPELVNEFSAYTGLNFDEQEKELTKKYEKVLSDLENGYTDINKSYSDQEKRILERIEANQATDADKYYIGLALMMPLLIGGIFGKEAALGALGGGAKGIADVLSQRQKNIREDEANLTDLYKNRSANKIKQGELEIEKLKIPEQIKKNLPKDEYEDIKNMNIHEFKDPNTGEVVASGPEILPDLYLDLKYGNTPEVRKESRKEASKLAEEKASLERANKSTSNIIQAAVQIKDPSIFGQMLALSLSENPNGALRKLMRQNAPTIIVDGREQNSWVYLDSQIESLKDAYRRNEQMKAYTNTIASHLTSMIENPAEGGLKSDDLINQVLVMRDRAQGNFVERAASKGFARQPLENKFGKMNRELYQGLNRREEKKELEKDKQLMYAS